MDPYLSGIIETTKGFLLSPVETFQKNAETSLSKAFQYYAILVVFYAILFSIVEGIVLSSGLFQYEESLFVFAIGLLVPLLICIIVVAALIGVFFQGLFQHIFVLLVGGEQGVVQTLKASMYSGVPALVLGWIPIVNIIAGIWSFVLLVLGIRELHEISTARAIAAVLIPGVLFILLVILLVLCIIVFIGIGILEMVNLLL